jgi:Uma2 family endonuclease
MVLPLAVADSRADVHLAGNVLLVVEVLSPSNRRNDLVLKRFGYGRAGIPRYWIVDGRDRTLTVLTNPFARGYQDELTIKAGDRWTTDSPFPVTLDPADFT